ncbi:hypothetical protein D3C76_1107000 [compost metagenome]
MQGIQQHATVALPGRRHHGKCVLQRGHRPPAHELEVHTQPVATGQLAQCREALGQPRVIRVVPGNRKALRTQLGACRQQRFAVGNLNLGRQRDELDIGNLHALTRHHRLQLAHGPAALRHWVGPRTRLHRVQAQPHGGETGSAGLAHQHSRGQVQCRQVGHPQGFQ